jgi:plasmid maintenance system antidote protein VapI
MKKMPKNYSVGTKAKVRLLRKRGWSLGEINQKMHIPKNTLSGWVKDIRLTPA